MRFILLAFTFSVFYAPIQAALKLSGGIQAESALLLNAENGEILFEKEPHIKRHPASTAKIATCLYALEFWSDKLDDLVVADGESLAITTKKALQSQKNPPPAYRLLADAGHIGIKKGEILSLRDLIRATLVVSACDASNVIATYLGGSIPQYLAGLDQFLREIGCQDTTIVNPHGYAHPAQLTTAYDLALITKKAIKNPIFKEIIQEKEFVRPKTNKQESQTYVATNKLLRKGPLHYPLAFGVKTGYHSQAGHCLVAAATHEGRTLIAVLLKNSDRTTMFRDAARLFDTAFKETPVHIQALSPQKKFTKSLPRSKNSLVAGIDTPLHITYYPAEKPNLKAHVHFWDVPLPIKKGQVVGEVELKTDSGWVWAKTHLIALEPVETRSWWLIVTLLMIGAGAIYTLWRQSHGNKR